eukprot:CAMPEP_0171937622 /NCGR_PEP_ID=MMETSP0993-20121228/34762_1 /TAXON_ID=483369 /ORGANISM="non described non described, Strain CCMP2098" /LENGTH=334 /DNA_ID=CAMNT_0012579005 /DNA_START=52 /DNA_END=1056 /DNA_ORIENTATION=+
MSNAHCYFSVTIGGVQTGTIVFKLYADVVPRTAANFYTLCVGTAGCGKSGKPLHFKGSIFHRIIKGFMCQGGDFTAFNGTGGESIYGEKFQDEKFSVRHTKAGLLSMANAGPNTNGSQFFITLGPTPHLNGKHVVFGEVVSGMEVVRQMEAVDTIADKPHVSQSIVVVDCGGGAGPKEEGDSNSSTSSSSSDDDDSDNSAEDRKKRKKAKKAKKAAKKSEKKSRKREKKSKKEEKKRSKSEKRNVQEKRLEDTRGGNNQSRCAAEEKDSKGSSGRDTFGSDGERGASRQRSRSREKDSSSDRHGRDGGDHERQRSRSRDRGRSSDDRRHRHESR